MEEHRGWVVPWNLPQILLGTWYIGEQAEQDWGRERLDCSEVASGSQPLLRGVLESEWPFEVLTCGEEVEVVRGSHGPVVCHGLFLRREACAFV